MLCVIFICSTKKKQENLTLKDSIVDHLDGLNGTSDDFSCGLVVKKKTHPFAHCKQLKPVQNFPLEY